MSLPPLAGGTFSFAAVATGCASTAQPLVVVVVVVVEEGLRRVPAAPARRNVHEVAAGGRPTRHERDKRGK